TPQIVRQIMQKYDISRSQAYRHHKQVLREIAAEAQRDPEAFQEHRAITQKRLQHQMREALKAGNYMDAFRIQLRLDRHWGIDPDYQPKPAAASLKEPTSQQSTDDELDTIARGGGRGPAQPASGTPEPGGVHVGNDAGVRGQLASSADLPGDRPSGGGDVPPT